MACNGRADNRLPIGDRLSRRNGLNVLDLICVQIAFGLRSRLGDWCAIFRKIRARTRRRLAPRQRGLWIVTSEHQHHGMN